MFLRLGEPSCDLTIDPNRRQKKVKRDFEEAEARKNERQDNKNDKTRSTDPMKSSKTKTPKACHPFRVDLEPQEGPQETDDNDDGDDDDDDDDDFTKTKGHPSRGGAGRH